MNLTPNSWASFREANPCHLPAGSPAGGQFGAKGQCSTGGVPAGRFWSPGQPKWAEAPPTSSWFHGSTANDLTSFSDEKIKRNDADAPYTGIWLSSDERTSPSFVNPTSIYSVEVAPGLKTLTRPEATQFARELYKARGSASGDDVRRALLDAGYGAVVHGIKPRIDLEELQTKGTTTFQLGWRPAELRYDPQFNGVDLFQRGDHITGFNHPQELVDQEENVLAVLTSRHLKITKRGPGW
jgi:hypothetical protein